MEATHQLKAPPYLKSWTLDMSPMWSLWAAKPEEVLEGFSLVDLYSTCAAAKLAAEPLSLEGWLLRIEELPPQAAMWYLSLYLSKEAIELGIASEYELGADLM